MPAAEPTSQARPLSGTLALSSLIASLDRAGLESLVRSRRVAVPTSVHDSLDLASELLKPESISQALTLLPRVQLARLARAREGAASREPSPILTDGAADAAAGNLLRARGLLGAGDAELPEVTAALDALLAARGLTVDTLLAGAPADAHGTDADAADTSSWFAAALAATGQAAWLLRELERTPAKLNRNGDVASAWLRTAEDRLAIPHAGELIVLLREAGLAHASDGLCLSAGGDWLAASHDDRWIALARAAVELMPGELRGLLVGATAGSPLAPHVAEFPAQFPLATEPTFAAIDRAAALWERIGLTVAGHFSDVGIAALRGALAVPGQAPLLGFPDPAPGIYIQPDLSVVVPGPLGAADEAALAAIALPEQLGVASTLRISEGTLSEAFHRGLDGAAIRKLIDGLALTGIPQPVDYLITALSERAGSIVVSPYLNEQWRTRVEFARPELRSTVLVDRRLAHLQLHEPDPQPTDSFEALTTDAAVLYSRLRADHVLAALLDARYPARGADGLVAASEGRERATGARMPAQATTPDASERRASATEALVERVLESASDGPTDTSRLITLAIRDRTRLEVSVEIRGEARTFAIVPVSLAGGRMRALDETAGVERTLPLEAITAITQLP
ncbi:hypothetical protein D3229_02810 [Leucobacter aridicollis]|nr:hypothetical protein [Leucobacter aridicollis]